MDYVEKGLTIDHFWTPESLQEWIVKLAYLVQGHPQRCKCPYCKEGENLRLILDTRPDLYHGEHCGRGCHHQRRYPAR